MSENHMHGSNHDFPENHFRQPIQPVNPDPLFAFPPEFPFPDPGYAGPFIVINQMESPAMSGDTDLSEHNTGHPVEMQSFDSTDSAQIPCHNGNHPTGAPDEETHYL